MTERRGPDFEDERIRGWRARPEDRFGEEDDPTVMAVDADREEIFESRVYQVRAEYIERAMLQSVADEPSLLAAMFLLADADDATFRVLAKRDKASGRLSFMMAGRIGEFRALLGKEDDVDEERFREFVGSFESDAYARGLVYPPAVVTLDQWRAYDPRNLGPEDTA
ncbi:MAG: hypothetical protein KC482_01410 [Dehalococcoidia bacterium]|nr:hypothetical protein [Dehalococcoidia bacterium]